MKTTELTQNDKLIKVFNTLIAYLSPEEKSKKYYKPEKPSFYSCGTHGYSIFQAECNFNNINNIPDLFPDIAIEVNKDHILILGETFEYYFAPDQILTVYNRIKKVLNN